MGFSLRLLTIRSRVDLERELAPYGLDRSRIEICISAMTHRILAVENTGRQEAELLAREMASHGGEGFIPPQTSQDPASASVILAGTEKQFRRLASSVAAQSPPLSPLVSDIDTLLQPGFSPSRTWRLARRSLDLSRPRIMGILNVTPDSFYAASRCTSVDMAVEHALRMEEQGADIIDIGGESTRPNSLPVPAEEQLRRIIPVLERLADRVSIPISIDTFSSVVARECLSAGAEIINDISGLTFDPDLAPVVAGSGAGVVLMHTRGRPQEMQNNTRYEDLVPEIVSFLENSVAVAQESGIHSDAIVVDPGIGFGKNMAGNLEILRRLSALSVLGRPILLGTSRKSFIGHLIGDPDKDRIFGTAATVALGIAEGASIFRVHDVSEMRDVVDTAHAILATS